MASTRPDSYGSGAASMTIFRRGIVEDKVNSLAVAIIDHMMHHDVVQLERKMRARRHALRAHHELNPGIGYERNMNAVSHRKGGVKVFMPCDPAARQKSGHHGSQKCTARRVAFRYHLVRKRQGLVCKQIPATGSADLNVRPSFAEKQNYRLSLGVYIIVGLPPVVGVPRRFFQRQHPFREGRAVELSEGDGCLIQYHVTSLVFQVASSIP